MNGKKNRMTVRRIVDICMTVLLLCLMAYQVTGEEAHSDADCIIPGGV